MPVTPDYLVIPNTTANRALLKSALMAYYMDMQKIPAEAVNDMLGNIEKAVPGQRPSWASKGDMLNDIDVIFRDLTCGMSLRVLTKQMPRHE